jgi:hypothetical protein
MENTMMKKTISLVGALFLAVSVAACGGSKKDETMPATTPAPAEPAMDADGGMAPQSMAPGNPCGDTAAAGNPCAAPK